MRGFEICIGQIQGDIRAVNHKVAIREKKSLILDSTLKELEECIRDIDEDLEALEPTVENVDNLQRKNKIKVRGLREEIEGKDLVGFLAKLFSDWVGINSGFVVSILAAFLVGAYKDSQRYPRDIIVKFLKWSIKSKVLEACWNNSNPAAEGAVISIYPDISPLTLEKRRSFKFLTDELPSQKFPICGAFHLVQFRSKTYSLRLVREAEQLCN